MLVLFPDSNLRTDKVMTESSRLRQRAVDAAVVLLLATLTIVTYAPVLSFEFVDWDGPKSVTENPAVQGGLTLEGVAYALTTVDLGNWIPLTWLSLELDATLFGVSPAAFHATNVFWHAVAAVVLAPDSADFHFNLAVFLEELGEKTLAREHFETVLRLSPSDPEPALRIERLKRP